MSGCIKIIEDCKLYIYTYIYTYIYIYRKGKSLQIMSKGMTNLVVG